MIDIMYVAWMKAVETEYALLAGIASVGVALPGLLGYLEIIGDRKMMKPYLFGLFCGTMAGTYLIKLINFLFTNEI